MTAGRRSGLLASLLVAGSCTLGWHHDGGVRKLAPASAPGSAENAADEPGFGSREAARAMTLVLPPDWSWFERGNGLFATRDGVFLQHLFIERIHLEAHDERVVGAFPLEALSAKQWPIRTARHLGTRFTRGMGPLEAAAVLLESRRNDPLVAELELQELVLHPVAGQPGFKLVFEFRLKQAGPRDLELGAYGWPPFATQGRATPYRTTCYGFVLGDWFYAIGCTAARRHYADAYAGAFDAIVRSVKLVEPARE
jgi:hypothetical protein